MTLTEELLTYGLADWIDLSWMAGVARRRGLKEHDEIQRAVLCSLAEMLRAGWIKLGDAAIEHGQMVGVRAWDIQPSEAIDRIRREWDALGEPLPGDVCWYELTEAGELEAKRVESSRQ